MFSFCFLRIISFIVIFQLHELDPDTDPEDRCPLVEDDCSDPCIVDPEPGPHNDGNVVQFGDKCKILM